MFDQKKRYLSQYLLQTSRIYRLKKMTDINTRRAKMYSVEIKNAEKLRSDIENKIRRVDDGILSEILFLKYVCGKNLFEVSIRLNYSERHIQRLYKKALSILHI